MEYIEGACRLTDLGRIERMGLSVARVAQSVCEVFSAQVFEMGFVQADGHPRFVVAWFNLSRVVNPFFTNVWGCEQ